MHPSTTDRGQSGLDRLLVFVVAVVGLLVVAPHALGFAGIDVGPRPGGGSDAVGDHDLIVLEARGTAVDAGDGSIGAVRLIVTPSPGREPVDLGDGLAIWVADRSYYLSPSGDDGFDGAYRARVIDGEGRVLEGATDRGELVFDLGGDDVAGVPEFGSRLRPGETVSVILVTPHGETLTRELEVPETASGDEVPL